MEDDRPVERREQRERVLVGGPRVDHDRLSELARRARAGARRAAAGRRGARSRGSSRGRSRRRRRPASCASSARARRAARLVAARLVGMDPEARRRRRRARRRARAPRARRRAVVATVTITRRRRPRGRARAPRAPRRRSRCACVSITRGSSSSSTTRRVELAEERRAARASAWPGGSSLGSQRADPARVVAGQDLVAAAVVLVDLAELERAGEPALVAEQLVQRLRACAAGTGVKITFRLSTARSAT